jgi:hypothetical protein
VSRVNVVEAHVQVLGKSCRNFVDIRVV